MAVNNLNCYILGMHQSSTRTSVTGQGIRDQNEVFIFTLHLHFKILCRYMEIVKLYSV